MAFTRDWDETSPTDNNYGYELDDYIRYLRTDCSDRVKDMLYGFTAGENDGNQGFKKVTYKQQSSAAGTPKADEIVLYSIDDGSNCGLYAKNESGYVKQILKQSGTSLLLNVDSGDTTGKALGAITVSGLTASANLDIGAYELRAQTLQSDVATGTAPMTIASTTKVTNLNADKIDGYDVAAYAGAESYTFVGGLIIKCGVVARTGTTTTVTFGAAFTTGIVTAVATSYLAGSSANPASISAYSTSAISIEEAAVVGASTPTHYHWIAIGY